jgi:hypothetical protein
VTRAVTALATTHGYTTAFEVAAGIAFAGFLISLIVIRVPRTRAADSPVVVEV